MQLILSNSDYTFDASAKEITLLLPFDLLDEEQILRITNLETRAVIYDSERRTYPIAVAAGVITHTYDLAGMADADTLQILVDDGTSVGAEIDALSDTLLFDDFDDESLSTTLWGAAVVVGSTTVTESSSAPNTLRIYNPSTGTAGAGYIPSILTFGRNKSIRSKIDVYNGEAAGDGEQCVGRIELYADSDNYVQFGAYRDTSAAVNSRGYIWYNIAGAGATTVDVDTTDLDNIAREYRVDVTEENILFYIDDILVYTLKDASLDDYYVRAYGTSQDNTDDIDIRFDYVKVLRLSEDRRLLLKKLLQIQGGTDSIGTVANVLNSSMDLGHSSGSITADGTEQDVYSMSDDTPFIFNNVDIDLSNMALNDVVVIKKYKHIDSSTEVKFEEETFNDAQDPPGLNMMGTEGALYGVRITIQQTAGTNRVYKYAIYDEVS